MITTSNTIFGGPDKTRNILRDTLLAHINDVPANGQIYWMSYYFNEPILFDALIAASKRGVEIRIIIDGNPRCADINNICITMFKAHSDIKISVVTSKPIWEYIGIKWHTHMHSKLYYFSHPRPHALVGSYNPTTDTQAIDAQLIKKIGDHTISHNVLVNIDNNKILTAILKYFRRIESKHYRRWSRFYSSDNRIFRDSAWSVNFLPRLVTHPVNLLLKQNDNNAKILCAISHLKGPNIIKPLIKASERGKQIELILDSTQRRVPKKLLDQLELHNIKYKQLNSNQHCLMHNKFIIYKSNETHCVLFGSFNWSIRSWWLNHEIIVTTQDRNIISSFENRWQEMLALK